VAGGLSRVANSDNHKLRQVIKKVTDGIVKLQQLAIHSGWRQHPTSQTHNSFIIMSTLPTDGRSDPVGRNTGNKAAAGARKSSRRNRKWKARPA